MGFSLLFGNPDEDPRATAADIVVDPKMPQSS